MAETLNNILFGAEPGIVENSGNVVGGSLPKSKKKEKPETLDDILFGAEPEEEPSYIDRALGFVKGIKLPTEIPSPAIPALTDPVLTATALTAIPAAKALKDTAGLVQKFVPSVAEGYKRTLQAWQKPIAEISQAAVDPIGAPLISPNIFESFRKGATAPLGSVKDTTSALQAMTQKHGIFGVGGAEEDKRLIASATRNVPAAFAGVLVGDLPSWILMHIGFAGLGKIVSQSPALQKLLTTKIPKTEKIDQIINWLTKTKNIVKLSPNELSALKQAHTAIQPKPLPKTISGLTGPQRTEALKTGKYAAEQPRALFRDIKDFLPKKPAPKPIAGLLPEKAGVRPVLETKRPPIVEPEATITPTKPVIEPTPVSPTGAITNVPETAKLPIKPPVSGGIETLKQEALKYKNADEFVQAYNPSNFSKVIPDELIDPASILKPHEITDIGKVDRMAKEFTNNGYMGRPILAVDTGYSLAGLTGSHRIEAAERAGVDIPVYIVNMEIVEKILSKPKNKGFDLNWFLRQDTDTHKALFENVDKNAYNLMKEEEIAEGKKVSSKIKFQLKTIWNEARTPSPIKGGEKAKKPISDIKIKEKPGGIATRTNKAGKVLPMIRRSGYAGSKLLQDAVKAGKIRDGGGGVADELLTPVNAAITQGKTSRENIGENLVWKFIGRPNKMANVKEIKFAKKADSRVIGLAKKYKINTDNNKEGEIVFNIMDKVPNNELASLSPQQLAAKYPSISEKPNHFAFAKELRVMLDEWHNRANSTRKELGKKEIGYLDNYISHMRKTDLWSRLQQEPKTTISEVNDFIIPNEKFNPFAQKRLEAEFPMEKNIFKILPKYIRAMASDISQTPNIENMKAQIAVMREGGLNRAAAYWDNYIRTGIIGKPGWLDAKLGVLPGTKRYDLTNFIQKAKVTGAMPFNIPWSIAVQPTSYVQLTPKEAGWRNSAAGVFDYLAKPKLRKQISKFPSMMQKGERGSSVVFRGATDDYDYAIYRSIIDKFNDVGGAFSKAMEKYLHGSSIAAGLREGRNKGLSGKNLVDFADIVGERTQSMYSRKTRAPILNNLTLRAGTPFQSFAIEMNNHLREIVGNVGYTAPQRVRLGHAISLIAGMTIAYKYAEMIRGRGLDPIPATVPFFGGMLSVAAQKAMPGARFGAQRQPLAPLQDVEDIIKGADTKKVLQIIGDYVTKGYTTNEWDPNWSKLRRVGTMYGMGMLGISGSAQMNRTIDGIIMNEKGYRETQQNKMAFPLEESMSERTKAVIFGPYSTKLGREYLDKRLGAFGEDDTESLKEIQETEGQAAFIEEYKELIKEKLIARIEKEMDALDDLDISDEKYDKELSRLEREEDIIDGIGVK